MNTSEVKLNGYEKLWGWFGLSRASWLTMPRVMMHEMPDEWQSKMADLLREWDATWDSGDMPSPHVSAKRNGKFTRWPEWLLEYRHPKLDEINGLRHNLNASPADSYECAMGGVLRVGSRLGACAEHGCGNKCLREGGCEHKKAANEQQDFVP